MRQNAAGDDHRLQLVCLDMGRSSEPTSKQTRGRGLARTRESGHDEEARLVDVA
jgi:hypothetical protein